MLKKKNIIFYTVILLLSIALFYYIPFTLSAKEEIKFNDYKFNDYTLIGIKQKSDE
jgi:hypothetical protein